MSASILSRRTPLFAAPAALEAARAPRAPSPWHRLDFDMQPQQRDNWCWAAVTASSARFLDAAVPWTQCLVAERTLGIAGCCQDGTPACDVEWYLERALSAVSHLRTYANQVADLDAIRDEIDQRRPLALRYAWAGGGAHFLVIDGYLGDPSGRLHTSDSIYGETTLTYDDLQHHYQNTDGSWTSSYWVR